MGLADTVKLYSNFIRLRLKNGDPREYDRHWESFWKTVDRTGADGEVPWDAAPQLAVAEDLPRFLPLMDRSVPILDLGCGNGRQSRYLAKYFDKVIGVDVAPSAVELARQETTEEKNVEYRVLDATRPDQAKALNAEFGDMNIYNRTVMHVIQKVDRPRFVESLRILLGERGVLYQVELTSKSLNTLRALPVKGKFGLPPLVEKVVEHGAIPVGFDAHERISLFPEGQWQLLKEEAHVPVRTIPMVNGKEAVLPGTYLIVRPSAAAVRMVS